MSGQERQAAAEAREVAAAAAIPNGTAHIEMADGGADGGKGGGAEEQKEGGGGSSSTP